MPLGRYKPKGQDREAGEKRKEGFERLRDCTATRPP